jgi:hypothetical protein
MDIYGVTADRWDELLDMARAARQRGWWRTYGVDDHGYVSLEADATLVCDFTQCYVPGLLQTADYARELFHSALDRRTPERLRNAVTVRMIRQQRLTSADDPLELIAIMDESVLYRPVGGPTVMAAQLARLVEAAALDTVTLQVLPTGVGAHPAMEGVFTVLSFGDLGEPDVVYVEHPLGATQSEKEADIAATTLKFDRPRSDALSPADSVTLIRQAAERY